MQSVSSAEYLQCLQCRVSSTSCVSLACICVVRDTDRQMKYIIPPVARVPPSATGHHGWGLRASASRDDWCRCVDTLVGKGGVV